MDDEYWRRYRRRARQRAAAWMLLIIAPIGIVVAVVKVFEPMDHPSGDPRDDLVVRLLVYGIFVAFDVALMVGSARLLRRGADDNRV